MRIIVAMTGATGAVYGVRLLAALGEMKIETHLVLSRWAEVTLRKETGLSARELSATATVAHSRDDQGASIASGSFRLDNAGKNDVSRDRTETLERVRTIRGRITTGHLADRSAIGR